MLRQKKLRKQRMVLAELKIIALNKVFQLSGLAILLMTKIP